MFGSENKYGTHAIQTEEAMLIKVPEEKIVYSKELENSMELVSTSPLHLLDFSTF